MDSPFGNNPRRQLTAGEAPVSPAATTRELIAYFVLTFTLSWAIEVPLALSAQGVMTPIPPALHYLASFGPLLAAVIVTLASRGPAGLVALFAPLRRWRFSRTVTLFVISPIFVFAAIVLVTRLFQGAWPDLALLGQVDYLPYLGIAPALILWTVTFGLGEEMGWRGFALPRLQVGRSALAASLILGIFWAIWHIPTIFYRDTYREMGAMVVPMLATVAVVGSVTYTWLFNGSKGSLLAPVIFHGLFDFFSVWPAGIVSPGMPMTILMIFWAVRVIKIYGPAQLAPEPKVTL